MAFSFPAQPIHGTKTVVTAGTPLQLVATAGTVYASVIVIVPLRANTGAAYAGFSPTPLTQHVVVPWSISANEGRKIDLSTIWVDTANNGEGVAWEGLD